MHLPSQFCRTEIWAGQGWVSAQGLTVLRSRCWQSSIPIWSLGSPSSPSWCWQDWVPCSCRTEFPVSLMPSNSVDCTSSRPVGEAPSIHHDSLIWHNTITAVTIPSPCSILIKGYFVWYSTSSQVLPALERITLGMCIRQWESWDPFRILPTLASLLIVRTHLMQWPRSL